MLADKLYCLFQLFHNPGLDKHSIGTFALKCRASIFQISEQYGSVSLMRSTCECWFFQGNSLYISAATIIVSTSYDVDISWRQSTQLEINLSWDMQGMILLLCFQVDSSSGSQWMLLTATTKVLIVLPLGASLLYIAMERFQLHVWCQQNQIIYSFFIYFLLFGIKTNRGGHIMLGSNKPLRPLIVNYVWEEI